MKEKYLKTTIKDFDEDSDYATINLEMETCDKEYWLNVIAALQEEYGEDAIKIEDIK